MRKYFLPLSINSRLLALAIILTSASGFCATPTNATPAKTAIMPALPPVVIATSDFSIPANAAAGRDPFFPMRVIVSGSAQVSTNTVAPVTQNFLLQGISGTKAKRFALINGRTFGVGEDGEVTVGRSKVRIQCISIEEDSAVVESGGRQQKLKLRPGL